MKKFLHFLTICAVVIITAGNVWATDYYVATTGNDVTGDGSSGNPWLTIQHAIDNVIAGDIINVADGTYTITGAITVDKGVTITGNTVSPENVVVQYDPAENSLMFDMRASNATVQGIKVTGGKAGFWFNQSAVTGCTISNCILDFVGEYGIYMKNGGSGHTIDLCTISNTGQTYAGAPGVLIENCLDVTFSNNTLSSISDKGVYVRVCNAGSIADRVEVTGNNLSGCSYSSIQVYQSPYTYIYNNTISSTSNKGLNIIGPNASSQAARVVVEENSISGCPWGGILLTHDRYTYIYNNTIFSTGDKGISIANGENVTNSDERIIVEENNISGTKYPGIQVVYAVPYTYIYNNTLSGCNYHGADGTGDWDYASIHVAENCGNTIVESNDISDGINGIQIWSDNCTVTNNTIYNMGLTYADTKVTDDGTYYNSGIIVGTNWLTNNIRPTGTTITDNDIHGNYWGLYVRDYFTLSPDDPSVLSVTAEYNWWGDATGPYHNPNNTCGLGNPVSDNVDFIPWWMTATGPGTWTDLPVQNTTTGSYYCKIQDAIDDPLTLDGHTINVAAGTYHNDPSDAINKQITLLGAKANVDPAGSTDRGGETILTRDDTKSAFYVTASSVTINGFKLGTNTVRASRVRIHGATDVTFKYNIIVKTWVSAGHGVHIGPASDRAEISYNTIDNPEWEGIKNDGASDVVISNNYVQNVDNWPIITSGKAVISTNTVSNCLNGIRIDYSGTSTSDRVEVTGNTVSYIEYAGINITGAYAYVYNNTVHHSNYWGSDDLGDWDFASIHMESSATNSIIDGNTVYDGVNGIQTWANDVTITNNDIYDMGETYGDEKIVGDRTYKNSGILVGSNWGSGDIDPTGVVIQYNNIRDNYWGLFYSADLTNGVTAENNWWGDNTGPYHSTNLGGLGDPVSDNVDFIPWKTTIYNPTNGTYYVTIQDAINNADPNETIVLDCGTYNEQLTINEASLTLTSDCSTSVLDGSGSKGVNTGITVNTLNFIIHNLTIQNWDTGIFITSIGSATIDSCKIMNNVEYGVFNHNTAVVTNAELNWWGDASGPYHYSTNLGGSGNPVSDFVDFVPWYTNLSMGPTSSDIDIALYATSCSDFEVRLRALNNITNTTLTNVQFALKWAVSYGVDLVNFSSDYPLAQQGPTVQDGGFYYAVFVGADLAINNWVAGTEYTILSFNHNQAGSGTGDFVIGNDAWTTANNAMYYAELLGLDFTGINYENAIGVDLGLCPLYITGTFTAEDKIYDGNTDATFLTNNLTLDDVKAGDDVSLTGLEIYFADKNVTNNILVSITAASLAGTDAGKYELFLTGAPTDLADITPKLLTANVTGNPTKSYDGNTDATLISTDYTITGLIGAETITIDETFGTYASPDVGDHLVTVNLDVPEDFTPGSGTFLTNYTLPTVATGNGTITAISLTITAEDKTKVYDGAVFLYANYTVTYSGFISGEDENNLGGLLVFTGSAIAATAVGTWVITPGGYTSTNYTISYDDGELEITAVTLGLTVKLQGPYNSVTGLMDTDLNPSQLPNGQPFNVAPWNYTGTETLPALTNAVDWVLVELRSDINTMVGRCASLVYSDGTVSISINDVNFPSVVAGSDYYIVIWQRNHMPVMSASAQTVPVTSYNLTELTHLYGTNPAIDLGSSVYGMIAGDVTANGILKYSGPGNDRGPIIARIVAETGSNLINGSTDPGYWQEDVNMNSIVLYLGDDNDRGFILDNLSTLTGSPYLNNTYTSVVPGAVTGTKDGRSNDGPFDILLSESITEINIELETSKFIDNGMVDNIQFTLAWNAGDTEIENMLTSVTSDFALIPQGNPVELDGIMYQVYASVTPVYLPQFFNESDRVTVMTIENTFGQPVADRLCIADDVFTSENNAMYYVSVWGTDHTGIIHTTQLGMNDISNPGSINIYPNPVNNDVLYMQINTLRSEMLDIKIYDVQGKLMKLIEYQTDEVILNSLSIDVSDFTSGVYLINVIGETVLFRDRFIVN